MKQTAVVADHIVSSNKGLGLLLLLSTQGTSHFCCPAFLLSALQATLNHFCPPRVSGWPLIRLSTHH